MYAIRSLNMPDKSVFRWKKKSFESVLTKIFKSNFPKFPALSTRDTK